MSFESVPRPDHIREVQIAARAAWQLLRCDRRRDNSQCQLRCFTSLHGFRYCSSNSPRYLKCSLVHRDQLLLCDRPVGSQSYEQVSRIRCRVDRDDHQIAKQIVIQFAADHQPDNSFDLATKLSSFPVHSRWIRCSTHNLKWIQDRFARGGLKLRCSSFSQIQLLVVVTAFKHDCREGRESS